MRRRDFIQAIGGACPGRSSHARSNAKRMRRIGMLMGYSPNDPQVQTRSAAFLQGLQQLGWTVGQNVEIDYRWSAGNMDDTRKYAAELVALAPDVIFAPGTASLGPVLQATPTIPIVFALIPDPVGSGFINSLARPAATPPDLAAFDYGLGAKWLELLKELAPNVTRAAVIRDPAIASGLGAWAAIQSASPATGIEVSPINVADAGEIEGAVAAFAQAPNGGLIVTGSALAVQHRDLIIALAARHKLPAIYYDPYYVVAAGGLASYGRQHRTVPPRRRLCGPHPQGEKPAEMLAQQPTKLSL